MALGESRASQSEKGKKMTVHIYFAGGVKDGVIESIQDPPNTIRVPINEEAEHVYVRQSVELEHEKDGPYRGRKGIWVFTGVSYYPLEGADESS